MESYDLFNCSSTSNSITKKYVGDEIHLTIPTQSGTYTIKVNSVPRPDGCKCVMYDCFHIALGKWIQGTLEESEFIHDMKEVVNMVASGKTDNDVIYSLLFTHKAKNGRIIDSDVCTYISEILMAKIAVKGSCNRDCLLEQMMQVAERSFGDSLYITKYRRTVFGLQPYLITFKEFMCKER